MLSSRANRLSLTPILPAKIRNSAPSQNLRAAFLGGPFSFASICSASALFRSSSILLELRTLRWYGAMAHYQEEYAVAAFKFCQMLLTSLVFLRVKSFGRAFDNPLMAVTRFLRWLATAYQWLHSRA
jgi:hypothetical protein